MKSYKSYKLGMELKVQYKVNLKSFAKQVSKARDINLKPFPKRNPKDINLNPFPKKIHARNT